MAREDLLMAALSDFAYTLAGHFDIGDVLHDLTRRASAVAEATSAGVSLVEGGRLRFVTALDEATASLERVQEEDRAGPGVEACRSGEPVLAGTLAEVQARWPRLADRVRAAGFEAVAGIPLHPEGEGLGALDLYRRTARPWSRDDVRVARVLADMASSYVVNASELARQRVRSEQLERALESRIVIEQAKGVLAAERDISVDAAFELMREHARRHNADLHSTAAAVVRLGLRP